MAQSENSHVDQKRPAKAYSIKITINSTAQIGPHITLSDAICIQYPSPHPWPLSFGIRSVHAEDTKLHLSKRSTCMNPFEHERQQETAAAQKKGGEHLRPPQD
jgi:hypothetical protein